MATVSSKPLLRGVSHQIAFFVSAVAGVALVHQARQGLAAISAAIYAAREGMDALVIERGALGGQAGATDRIDNYPGFPDGISGQELADRLVAHARRYGVELLSAVEVSGIRRETDCVMVTTATGDMYAADAVILTTGIGLLGARAFAKVLDAPRSVLLAGVAVLCVVGSYAVNNSLFDVLVMVVFGVVGYLMPKVGMPVAPVGFGLILGPILEENIRRSLIVNGTWWVFLQRPISLAMLLVSVAALVYPMLRRGGTRGLLTGGQPPAGEP